MDESVIKKYFDLSEEQERQIKSLYALYQDWNGKINVISRKDMDSLFIHHILHSLSILKFYRFSPGAEILDLGTGGGFPGIPLSIMNPDTRFHLIDGTAKKLKVVQDVVESIGLENVLVKHIRAEEYKYKFDMVVTRAVAKVDKLMMWSKPLIKQRHMHAFPNGLIALKGGNIKEEMQSLSRHEYYEIHHIRDVFDEAYFEEKSVIYIQG